MQTYLRGTDMIEKSAVRKRAVHKTAAYSGTEVWSGLKLMVRKELR